MEAYGASEDTDKKSEDGNTWGTGVAGIEVGGRKHIGWQGTRA